MREHEPIRTCNKCLPDIKCDMIGSLGKIKARIATFVTLNQRSIIWNRIEECTTRKGTNGLREMPGQEKDH